MQKRTIPAIVRRILLRLCAAECLELDPWLRDDLRIARLTVAYAARGVAVLCSPDVLASYMVLGLHPEKVWPAIQARRKALGPFHEVLHAPAVPKKPAQSFKLWSEKTNGARAVNSRAGETLLRDNTISVPMAAPSIAAAYPNSDDSGSAKESPYFSAADLEEFFRTCPSELIPHRCLRTIQGMFIALETRLGKKLHGDKFEFFLSHEDYRAGCRYRSDRTLRNNLPLAVKLGFLEVVHRRDDGQSHHIWIRRRTEKDKGEYRWATTYRFPVSVLVKWRELQRRGHHSDVTPIRKPSQPAPEPLPPSPAAPLPKREQPAAEHRSPRRITRDERLALFSTYLALKKSGKPHDLAIAEVQRQFKDRYTVDEIEFAVKIVGAKESQRGERRSEMDAADFRRLMRELNLAKEAAVGSGANGEEIFRRACVRAGLSVERGEQLGKRFFGGLVCAPD